MEKTLSFKEVMETFGKQQIPISRPTVLCLPVEILKNIPKRKWKKGDIIDAFVTFVGNQIIIVPKNNTKDVTSLSADQAYVPRKVGDFITIKNTKMMLAGTKNGTPFFIPAI